MDEQIENIEDMQALAGDLPRGLGLIVVPPEDAAKRIGLLLYHSLAVHIASGCASFGLPAILPRKTLLYYASERQEERCAKQLDSLIQRSPARPIIETSYLHQGPLREKYIDQAREREVLAEMSRYGLVGIINPALLASYQISTTRAYDRLIKYAGALAERAETTLCTIVSTYGAPTVEYASGTIWETDSLEYATWSAHVLATDEDRIWTVHVVANGKTMVRLHLEDTGTGFRRPTQ